MLYHEVQEPVVRFQRTSVQEYVNIMAQTQMGNLEIDSDFEENNQPLQVYRQLTEENLTSERICHAPAQYGVMFYIDQEDRLFVCSTAYLTAN